MGVSKELYEEAQKRLVASILYDNSDVPRVLETVSSDDFKEPSLQLLFSVIGELSREGSLVSDTKVAEKLSEKGLLKQVGGPAKLYSMRREGADYLISAPSLVYAEIVHLYAEKDRTLEILDKGVKSLDEDSSLSLTEAVSSIQSSLSDTLSSVSSRSTVTDAEDLVKDFPERLRERERIRIENEAKSGGLQGIPTSLPSLNKYTTGWLGGQMITVGAQTAIGKSVFAVNSAMAAGAAGCSVMFFSLEMSREEIEDRMVASITGVPMETLKQGEPKEAWQKKALSEGYDEFKQMKFNIDTDPNLTIDAIKARAMKKAQSPEGLDLIIIDYLQLVTPSNRSDNRQQMVADMSRQVKLMAKEMGIPVMVVVQLTRPSGDDPNEKPTMYKIRESGAIATDSDVVILLHRVKAEDQRIPRTQVIIEKNRNGPSGKTIWCHSNLACSAFREVTASEENLEASEIDDDLMEIDQGFVDDGCIDDDGIEDESVVELGSIFDRGYDPDLIDDPDDDF